jgi:E3 ubiquitin-protein ligase HUWE1
MLEVADIVLHNADKFADFYEIHNPDSPEGDAAIVMPAISIIVFARLCVSPVFLDAVIPEFLVNISKYSIPRMFSILVILRALLFIPTAQFVLIARMFQAKWASSVSEILNLPISTRFESSVIYHLLVLTFDYLKGLNNFNPETEAVALEIGEISNPFQSAFSNSITILRSNFDLMNPLRLIRHSLPPRFDFTSIETDRYSKHSDHGGYGPRDFLQNLHRFQVPQRTEHLPFPAGITSEGYSQLPHQLRSILLFHKLPPSPPTLTPAMHRYLLSQPHWVASWIRDRPSLMLLPEHYLVLYPILVTLPTLTNEQLTDVTLSEFLQPQLFKQLLDLALTDTQSLQTMAKNVLVNFGVNFPALDAILGQIADRVAFHPKRVLNCLIQLLQDLHEIKSFPDLFVVKVAPILLSVLPLESSMDLPQIVKLFVGAREFPTPAVQILAFLLIKTDQQQLIDLCSKLPAVNIWPYLKFSFKKILSDFQQHNPNPIVLSLYIEKFNELVNEFRPDLTLLLDHLLDNFDPQLLHLIGVILVALDPGRHLTEDIRTIESLYDQAPDFWNIIKKHSELFNRLIEDSSDQIFNELKIVRNYPEIMKLNLRVRFFRLFQLHKLRDGRLILIVQRDTILSDSFARLSKIHPEALLDQIRVQFIGENGIDIGGLTRDWFSTLVKAIFNPNFTLFIPAANGRSSQPNPLARRHTDNFHEWYRFAGRIIARAIIEGICVDAHMTRPLLKHLRGLPMTLKDLETVDQEQYESLVFLLEHEADQCGLTFSIEYDEFGANRIRTLIPNGSKIEVTDGNKEEYVQKVVEWRLTLEIEVEIRNFVGGFHELIKAEELKVFSVDELELLICGVPEIDVRDFRVNCHFIQPYSENHPVIVRFFRVFQEFTVEERARFLLFLTGSSQVPFGGFRTLEDMQRPIKIAPGGTPERLPAAHTCVNQLDLPEYETEEDMRGKILFAIQECNSFGFA